MVEDSSKDTSVRVDRQTKNHLDKISSKEGLSVKECLFHMSVFFVKNDIGVKDEYISTTNYMERIIKILRAYERDFFIPGARELNKMIRFTETIAVDNADFLPASDEEPEAVGASPSAPVVPEVSSEDLVQLEKHKRANKKLVEVLDLLTDTKKMTIRAGVGGSQSYILKLSPQEIDDIKRTIQICTIP